MAEYLRQIITKQRACALAYDDICDPQGCRVAVLVMDECVLNIDCALVVNKNKPPVILFEAMR